MLVSLIFDFPPAIAEACGIRCSRQMRKKIEIKIYDDAGHAFENPNGERCRAADAADAGKRTLDFLPMRLKK